MTLYDFKLLDLNMQADATWEKGILIGFRNDVEQHMILYRVDDFYVEIYYDSIENEITWVKSFISEEPLQPYLDKIDISSLLKYSS